MIEQNTSLLCPLCHSDEMKAGIEYIDLPWEKKTFFRDFQISYCLKCGFGFVSSEIRQEDVEHFYKYEYRSERSGFYIDFDNLRFPDPFVPEYDYRALAQLFLAKQYVEMNPGDTFADIGPGTGNSFYYAKHFFPLVNLVAIELSVGAANAYKRLFGVSCYEKLDQMKSNRLPKIILSSHVLEHFTFPELKAHLADIKASLHDEGIFIAEVPHTDFRTHTESRINDAPHFLFFSTDSLKQIFENAGFDVLFLNTCARNYSDYPEYYKKKENVPPKPFLATLLTRIKNRIGGVRHQQVMDINDVNFAYSGDRDCIRIAVSKKK